MRTWTDCGRGSAGRAAVDRSPRAGDEGIGDGRGSARSPPPIEDTARAGRRRGDLVAPTQPPPSGAPRVAAALVTLPLVVAAVAMAASGGRGPAAVSDVVFVVVPLIAALCCWWAAWSDAAAAGRGTGSPGRDRRRLLVVGRGQRGWAVYRLSLHQLPPSPSLADLRWLGYGLPAAAGLLAFPAVPRRVQPGPLPSLRCARPRRRQGRAGELAAASEGLRRVTSPRPRPGPR